MDATQLQLPDDVETLRTLLLERDAQLTEQQSTIHQLQLQNAGLAHRLDLALRRIYGRLSEKIDPKQLLLFGELMQQAAKAMETLADDNQPTAKQIRRKGHGRRPLPADLPRHRVEHVVDPVELTCPCCDQERVRIGEEVSEQLDYTPASLFVIQHIRPKLACRRCEDGGVYTAEKPLQSQVIDKGLPGPGLVSHVITSKYADHQPLYRLEGILARHGVEIARSTMCGWMKAASDLVVPLVKLMSNRVRQSKVLHTDDTSVPVQAPGRNKTKTGRMWVYLGDHGNPYNVFDYTPSRNRDGPVTWLSGFKGYLQADAFGGYDGIYATGEVTEVACWAHARRKFYDARKTDPVRSHQALSLIRLLYDVERDAKQLDVAGRVALRQQKSRPRLDRLRAWMDQERETVLPKSPMSVAIGYALNNWDALNCYITDGDLAIDNNAAERAIRPLTIGRKNYLFFGSDTGGRTAANLYSLVASAKRHGLDPFVYLRYVLNTIASTPINQIDQFLPDLWKAQQLKEIVDG